MATYLISYDLQKPGQSYDTLLAALKQQGAKKVLYSQWVLKTSSTVVQVRDWVKQFIDANDRVLVNELNANWASFNAMTDLNQV